MAYVSIRQHTSAYVSIRQHTSAYRHPHTRLWLHELTHYTHPTSASLWGIRQHTYGIRQHTSAYRHPHTRLLLHELTHYTHTLQAQACGAYVSIRTISICIYICIYIYIYIYQTRVPGKEAGDKSTSLPTPQSKTPQNSPRTPNPKSHFFNLKKKRHTHTHTPSQRRETGREPQTLKPFFSLKLKKRKKLKASYTSSLRPHILVA